MKRVVLNRKNSLFVGNPRGGRTAAILASLTSTCRRQDVTDPQARLNEAAGAGRTLRVRYLLRHGLPQRLESTVASVL
jgi:hypothetical protein